MTSPALHHVYMISHVIILQMTGRKGRVVSTDDGGVQYESRSESDVPLEILNLTEKQRFMDGDKVRLHKIFVCSVKVGYR